MKTKKEEVEGDPGEYTVLDEKTMSIFKKKIRLTLTYVQQRD